MPEPMTGFKSYDDLPAVDDCVVDGRGDLGWEIGRRERVHR